MSLSREQQRLHGALCELGEALGAMYLGGLHVLHDTANPDRVAQSAHSMRELMEKIVDPKRRPGLTSKVIEVDDVFRDKKPKTNCRSESGAWDGTIDSPLRKILKKLEGFLDWYATRYPRMKERFRRALRRWEGSDHDLHDEASFGGRWKTWQGLNVYFQAVSHHGKSPSAEELGKQVARLEDFLARHLLKTYDDLDEIDALLKESGNA